jgi:succinyl-diaminopimelate desuccinylase
MSDLTRTLKWLVDIPSVTGSEGRIATAIAGRLLPIWTIKGVQRFGNSLVVGARTDRPLITLYGHLDTVPEQDGNGAVRIDDGRMYGLGTSDMKAGIAVMIHLLEDEGVRSGEYDVVGVFYEREEGPVAENGLEKVLDSAPWLVQSEMAVVLEPTDLKLELGCNGTMTADVVFRGRAAHSARPWLGENAITKAGRWLNEMDAMEPRAETVSGLDYHEVFTVTKAEGGVATNIVPAEFRLSLNYRFPPTLSVDEAEARLRKVAAAADEVIVTDAAPPGLIPEGNKHLLRLEGLLGEERFPKQGWTDVARLTALGIPAVNYGPGDPEQAHQSGESVPLGNLTIAYSVLRHFLGA